MIENSRQGLSFKESDMAEKLLQNRTAVNHGDANRIDNHLN